MEMLGGEKVLTRSSINASQINTKSHKSKALNMCVYMTRLLPPTAFEREALKRETFQALFKSQISSRLQ